MEEVGIIVVVYVFGGLVPAVVGEDGALLVLAGVVGVAAVEGAETPI